MKTLYMKSTYLFMVFAMILGFTLTGCSDDNSGDPSTSAEFPELKEFTCNAGETKDLSFTAGADWALSSNAGWCKFKNGEFTESTISGKAGSQTVQVVITNDGQNFEKDDIAELTLKMGNSSQVICKITRPHKIPVDIVITDEEGNVYDAEHPIIIKGSAPLSLVETVITVEADFEVGLPEYPDWVAVNAKGNGVYALSFKDDNKSGISNKYSFGTEKGYTLTFAVQYNKDLVEIEVPVGYEGLKADYLSVDPSFTSVHWVSKDGKTISANGGVSGTESDVYEEKLSTTITTRNDDYEVIKIEQIGDFMDYPGMDPAFYPNDFNFNADMSWINVQKDGENLSLSFAENSSDTDIRAAIIMAFPRDVYEAIKDDLKGNILEDAGGYYDIATKYTRNIVANVVQEYKLPEAPVVSFAGYIESNGTLISFEEVTANGAGEAYLDKFYEQTEYGTDNVYTASVEKKLLSYGAMYLEVKNYEEGMSCELPKSDILTFTTENKDGKFYIKVSGNAADVTEQFDCIITKDGSPVSVCLISFF